MTSADTSLADVARASRGRALRRFFRDWLAVVAAVVLVALLIAALLAPWISPHDPFLTGRRRLLPPVWDARGTWTFVLGTDGLGRCLLSRLLHGLRMTIGIALAATAIGGAIGLLVGLFSAYCRKLDGLLMRTNDVLLSIPAILIGLAFAAVIGPGLLSLVVALAISNIPTVARVTRGAALTVMGQDFIEAGRSIGLSDSALIWRYLALNCVSSVFVYLTLRFAQTILLASALSFLGLGAQPPTAELGTMAAGGRNDLFIAPHVATLPSLAIVLVVLCANILGDALRDTLDPRLRNT